MDGVVVVLEYQWLTRKLITKLKYKGVKDMRDDVVEVIISMGDLSMLANKELLVTGVPLHWRREWERGFNQADELARLVALYLNQEWRDDLLRKTRTTKPQMKLKAKERQENLVNAFELNGDKEEVKGRSILIVDDVWTTGATMRECAKVLKKAGAKNVWGLAVAG
jgi:ComF family protein